MGREANSELSRIKPGVRGSGQGFLGALKREPIELDRCKIGSKVATSGDEALRSHVAKSSLKSIGVGEGAESAPGHLDLLPFRLRSRDVLSLSRNLSSFQKGVYITRKASAAFGRTF